MRYIYAALLALVAIAAYAADPVSLQQLLQSSPKETSPQGQTSIVTVRGGVVRRFSLMSTAKLLPVATATSPGVVKVGTGLAVMPDGTLNNTGVAGVASFHGRGGAVTPATGDYSIGQITGAATVASTGSYADLSNKPTIPAGQINSDWNAASGVARILNKPTIPSALSQLTQSELYRTVTDSEKEQWNNNSSPVKSFNGRTGTIMPESGDYTSVMVGADALGSATSVQTNLDTHTARIDNPHAVTKAQVGLSNVDNTSDLSKPISTVTQAALDAKANTSALGTAAAKNIAASGNASSTEVVMGNDTRLTDARTASDVSAWAKAATKPTYTASEVGAVSTTGNAATATALAANGANCSAGQAPLGVNASGVVEGCFAVATPSDVSAKLSDAPSDGSAYARKDGAWSVVGSGTISGTTPTTFASGTVLASDGTKVRAATAPDLNAILDTGATQITVAGSGSYLPSMSTGTPTAGCATLDASGNLSSTGIACSTSSMVYPSNGIPNAYNGAWGSSYALVTSIRSPGDHTSIPTEAAVRSAISSLGTGTLGGSTGSTDNAMLVASGTGGATVKATAATFANGQLAVPKAAGTPDAVSLEYGSYRFGWLAPSNLSANYYFVPQGTVPTAGQVMVVGTPTDTTVHDAAAKAVPVTYMTVDSGRYTPTISAASNMTSGTPSIAHWTRNKNEVTVTGYVVGNVTGTGTTTFSLSLPAASDLTIAADAIGTATGSPVALTGVIQADATNDVAKFSLSGNVSGAVTVGYSFTYTVQ